MKFGIYNRYAQDWWTHESGEVLMFDTGLAAARYIQGQPMELDNDEAEIIPLPGNMVRADAAMLACFITQGFKAFVDERASITNYSYMAAWADQHGGWCGIYAELMRIVYPLVERLHKSAMHYDYNYDGVYEYEVCEPLGEWFARFMIDNEGDIPGPNLVSQQITALDGEYWGRQATNHQEPMPQMPGPRTPLPG